MRSPTYLVCSALLVSTFVLDRLSTRQCALLFGVCGVAVSFLTLASLTLRTATALWLWTILYGATVGAMGGFGSVLNAQLFGTDALGAINGASTGVNLAASGVGPLLYSYVAEVTGRYDVAAIAGSAIHLALSLALIAVCAVCMPGTASCIAVQTQTRAGQGHARRDG